MPGAIFECPPQEMKSRFSAAYFPNQKVGIHAVFALEKRCWNKHVHFTADYILLPWWSLQTRGDTTPALGGGTCGQRCSVVNASHSFCSRPGLQVLS